MIHKHLLTIAFDKTASGQISRPIVFHVITDSPSKTNAGGEM